MVEKGAGSSSNRKRAKAVRRRTWLAGGLGLLVFGGVLVFAWTRQSQDDAVTRFMHLHGLAVPAWASGTLYLSTHQGLIRIDAEGTWRYVSEVQHDFMGFQANPTEAGVLYSSGHPAPGSGLRNPLGFMVSRDSGATWQVIALAGQVDFHSMAVQVTDGNVIYGWSGGLYRSLDGGQNWETIPAERLASLGGALGLAVHPEDADTLLAGTQRGLWRSTDGGASWEPVLPDIPVTAVSYVPSRPEAIVAYGAHPEAGLLMSEDGGRGWTRLGFMLEGNDAVGYIAIQTEESAVMYLGSYGQNLYQTSDGGKSWRQLAEFGVPVQP